MTVCIDRETRGLNRWLAVHLYGDLTRAVYGDGRDGEEAYEARVYGSEVVGDTLAFRSIGGGLMRTGVVIATAYPVTGSSRITVVIS